MAQTSGQVAKAFGAALRSAREAARLTQEALAENAGSSATYIFLLENGHQQPALGVVMAFESALGLPAGELVRRASEHMLGKRRAKS